MNTDSPAPAAPLHIWLQDGCDAPDCEDCALAGVESYEGVTWAGEPVHDNDTEYVRADEVARLRSEAEALREENTRLRTMRGRDA